LTPRELGPAARIHFDVRTPSKNGFRIAFAGASRMTVYRSSSTRSRLFVILDADPGSVLTLKNGIGSVAPRASGMTNLVILAKLTVRCAPQTSWTRIASALAST
jgi:hypothetical protein